MRRRKQIIGMILCMMLAVSAIPGTPVHAEKKVRNEVRLLELEKQEEVQLFSEESESSEENTLAKIRLSVGNGQTTPKYQAGQKVKLLLKIQNDGDIDAKNVSITPVIDDAKNWPFEIESMNYELKLGKIKAGETAEAKWELAVREDVESKAYKTAFQISYDDGTGVYTSDKYIYIKTTAKEKDDSKYEQSTEAEQQNPGGEITAMEGGGVYNSDPVSVGGSGNASVPRVIVTGFATDPGTVNAGSNFRLVVHVKNTSSATAVSNMLFDLQAPSAGTEAAAEAPAFLPASGSSTIYLDRIPAGETRDIAIDLNARADLVQKPYSITMTMMYEDGNAQQYEGTSSLAIPVQQAARFEFSDIEISPSTIQVGEEANITCSLYNTGRTKLYNVKVKFSGDGISAKDVFVGNVDSGASGMIDGMLTGESEMPAGTKCKMVVSYEDESGNVSTIEEEFEFEVTPAVQEDFGAAVDVPEENSFSMMPVVVVLVLVIVTATAVILIRRKKKKAALAEEEDLADEVDRFTEDE